MRMNRRGLENVYGLVLTIGIMLAVVGIVVMAATQRAGIVSNFLTSQEKSNILQMEEKVASWMRNPDRELIEGGCSADEFVTSLLVSLPSVVARIVGERKRTVRGELIGELASILWSYSTDGDEGDHLASVRSGYLEIDKLMSLIGSKAVPFESYLGEVAPKAKMLLQNENPQVTQDIECFREVKAVIDRADKLHEEAKKTRNRSQKQTLRIKAASLLKQAERQVLELEKLLSQRYPEVKSTVMSWLNNSLRYLSYSLERFLQTVPSQVQQQTEEVTLDGQSPLEWFLEAE